MFRITREAIDPRTLEAAVADPTCGAIATFFGVVRQRADDGAAVTGLTYEAYEPMALAEFETIAAEAREKYGDDLRIAIIHRIGALHVGEVAVAVAVASPHRAAAFDGCEYVIDELKARAPIWKKEHYADGAGVWKENCCNEG